MTLHRIQLERGFNSRLIELLESGETFAVISWINFPSHGDFKAGDLVEAETASRERFILRVEESRVYLIEGVPEKIAREAGFINGFSFQFVMRNLLVSKVLVTRFSVVRYVEYDF